MTAIWLPVYAPDPLETGSLGVGFLLNPPIILEACAGGMGAVGRHLVASVGEAERLAGVGVSVTPVRSPRPGRGYAVSAAAAMAAGLAASLALRRGALWGLRIAHLAEVYAGTGLGDVAAMAEGRFMELRLAAGAPGVGRVEYVVIEDLPFILAELGEMTTSEMHRILGERLYREAAPRLRRVFEDPRLETVLEEARGFSLALGMLPRRLDEELAGVRGVVGWYVKKKLLVVVAERGHALDVLDAVSSMKPVRGAGLYWPSGAGYTVRLRRSPVAIHATGASW